MGLRCNPKILPLSASIGLEHPLTTTKEGKLEWQRLRRAAFAKKFGYSLAAHYATGGQRERILQRDNYACVKCGMTDAQHKDTWGRPITIDHKSKDRSDNRDENLQTLCLSCHGNKDLIARLVAANHSPPRVGVMAHVVA